MPLGTWGPITFEVSPLAVRTWRDLQIARAGRWSKMDVYAGKPRKEFEGPDETTVRLTLRLDSQAGLNVPSELATLREQVAIGAYHSLVIGDDVAGDFYLKSMTEQIDRVDRFGQVQLATVAAQFEEYA